MPGLDRVNSPLFAAVNALIPIGELKNLKHYLNKFNYPETAAYIQSSGKELSNFYFKRDDPWAYFCYYRDYTWVDIPIFTRASLKRQSRFWLISNCSLNLCQAFSGGICL
jgi:hypothetical protein